MGTSTEAYHRKKKLRKEQEERNRKTLEKLESIRREQANK